jgi:hypothetical protein
MFRSKKFYVAQKIQMYYIFKDRSVRYNLILCTSKSFFYALCWSSSGAFRVLYSYRSLSVTLLSSLYTWIELQYMQWDKLARKTLILNLRYLEIILALDFFRLMLMRTRAGRKQRY